jgi:hypothetical protein
VIVRWIPLVTAAYGTWVARPARTTRLAPGGDGSQLNRRVRSVLGDLPPRGQEPGGLAAAGWGLDPGPWPWRLLLMVAGLQALTVVLWQSEAVHLIWADLWELVRSSGR